MNRRLLTVAAAGATAAFALALPLSAAPPGTNHNNSDATTVDCDGGTLTINAPEKLWPPNHKYYTDLYVLADGDNESDNITLESHGYHNQYDGDTETNGSGNTADDITSDEATPVASGDSESGYPEAVAAESETGVDSLQTDWKARAERSGRIQEGRTYTLSAIATFNGGDPCEQEVTFTVPHDMRPSRR